MHAALAMHPGRPYATRLFIRCIFRRAETHFVVELNCRIDIRREHIEVINAQWFHTTVELIFLCGVFEPVHRRVKLERNAPGIDRPQNASHERPFDPFCVQTLTVKINLRLVEIVFRPDFEGEKAHIGFARLMQTDTMMPTFFHRAQIEPAWLLMADLQAERVDIKRF